ncbi:hypothetical protein AMECASPLE_023413, partial [Ameca splendens]
MGKDSINQMSSRETYNNSGGAAGIHGSAKPSHLSWSHDQSVNSSWLTSHLVPTQPPSYLLRSRDHKTRWCWSSQVCWVTGATYSTDCQEEYLSRRLPALQYFESLSFGSMSLSFLDYVSEKQQCQTNQQIEQIATMLQQTLGTLSTTPPDGASAFPESFQSPHFHDVTPLVRRNSLVRFSNTERNYD